MDVTELTADELRELANQRSNAKTLDIDGLTVHVDSEKCKSWKAFRIMAQFTNGVTPQSLQTMIDFVELVSDVDEAAIVEHCGGDNASLEDVLNVISQIIVEATPKKF